MTNAELYNILIDNGWTIRKGIDDCAYKQLSDRQIELIPNIKKLIARRLGGACDTQHDKLKPTPTYYKDYGLATPYP